MTRILAEIVKISHFYFRWPTFNEKPYLSSSSDLGLVDDSHTLRALARTGLKISLFGQFQSEFAQKIEKYVGKHDKNLKKIDLEELEVVLELAVLRLEEANL